jgi:chemotaxis protein CheX
MDETVIPHLVTATRGVFDSMVFMKAEPEPPMRGLAPETDAHIVASVAFVGEQSGLVAFHTSAGTAKIIAGAMLGIPADQVDGEAPDAMGEVANMIAGGFRLALKSAGTDVAISVPTVITGTDFRTKYVTPVRRVLCPFRLEGGAQVHVELIVNE